VGISIVLVVINWQLALPVLLALPILWLLTRWFRNQSERAYRETRDAIALVIVHFVESLGGIQAVHAFRREPRNQEIYEHLDDRYRRANVWSQRLAAGYGPGVQLVGRMTTAVVVFYGGWLAIDGRVSVGVLAAFLLYLRRFFEPMQELSQFYNLFQAAVAGLEKLSGVLEEPLTVAPPAVPGTGPWECRRRFNASYEGVVDQSAFVSTPRRSGQRCCRPGGSVLVPVEMQRALVALSGRAGIVRSRKCCSLEGCRIAWFRGLDHSALKTAHSATPSRHR